MVNPAKTLGKLVKHANDNTLFEITDVVDAKLSGRRMSDGWHHLLCTLGQPRNTP